MASGNWERLTEELLDLFGVASDIHDQVSSTPQPVADSTTTLGTLMWMTFLFYVIGQGMIEGISEKPDAEASPKWRSYYRAKNSALFPLVAIVLACLVFAISGGWIMFFKQNFFDAIPNRAPIAILPAAIFVMLSAVPIIVSYRIARGWAPIQHRHAGKDAEPEFNGAVSAPQRRVFAWLAFFATTIATLLIIYGCLRDNM